MSQSNEVEPQKFDPSDEAGLKVDGHSGINPAEGEKAQQAFRSVLGQFATGVTVMTTLASSGEKVGLTVNSFNSLSLDPPLILWSIANSTPSFECFQVGEAFAVNVLSSNQEDLALQLAQTSKNKFQGIRIVTGLDNVPLINGCVAYLECNVDARHPGGDHDIIVGHVTRVFNLSRAPLLFHGGEFRTISD